MWNTRPLRASLPALLLLGASLGAAPVPVPQDVPPDPKHFGQAIEELATGKRSIETATFHVHWAGNARGFSADIHGNGVGILNRQTQFHLTREKLRSLARMLHQAGFADMKDRYGGFSRPQRGPAIGAPEVLKGSVSLTILGVSKGVTQLGAGEQSDALAGLAIALLNVCAEAARENGITAESLTDGLNKVGSGKLDPQMLQIVVQRLLEKPNLPGEGFLMRLQGDRVVSRTNTRGKGLGPEKELRLTTKQLAEVAHLLVENDAASFPINLYAITYTDLRIEVLGKEKSIQARPFARLTPQTHGEKQKQFDRVYTALEKLHQRVKKEGKEVKVAQR